jgi:hypothetical protein
MKRRAKGNQDFNRKSNGLFLDTLYSWIKSHESKFRESLENTYLSPEKKQRLCEDSIIIPMHTASQGTRSSRSGSCKLRSQSRHTLRLTRQARCPPSPSTRKQRSGSSTTVGSRASNTRCPPSPPTGRHRSVSSTTEGSRASTTTSPGKGRTWWTLTLSPPPSSSTQTTQASSTLS